MQTWKSPIFSSHGFVIQHGTKNKRQKQKSKTNNKKQRPLVILVQPNVEDTE